MNEQPANLDNEFLWKLLANPADNSQADITALQSLVPAHPQSGILQVLLTPNGNNRDLQHAAAYFDPATLHKLSAGLDNLPAVTDAQIIYNDDSSHTTANSYFTAPIIDEPFVPPVIETPLDAAIQDINPTEDTNENPVYTFAEEPDSDTIHQDPETAYNTFAEQYADTPQKEAVIAETVEGAPLMTELIPEEKGGEAFTDEDSELAKEYAAYLAQVDAKAIEPVEDKVAYFHQDIDDVIVSTNEIEDEIYDEIVGIDDISLERLNTQPKQTTEEKAPESVLNTSEPVSNIEDSHFVFETEINEGDKPETTAGIEVIPQNESNNNNIVSRYNDEKMPYSFMWWLDKTRKEHADTYQPYISDVYKAADESGKKAIADELQHQYYENIMSNSSIDEFDQITSKNTTTPPARKENKIIERFIQESPQIKHPSNIKLTNENKAKKSSEDREEIVTETLARIYIEQMLYDKAILIYKKMMLKFPEKSLYFAGQIEQIRNKIN